MNRLETLSSVMHGEKKHGLTSYPLPPSSPHYQYQNRVPHSTDAAQIRTTRYAHSKNRRVRRDVQAILGSRTGVEPAHEGFGCGGEVPKASGLGAGSARGPRER